MLAPRPEPAPTAAPTSQVSSADSAASKRDKAGLRGLSFTDQAALLDPHGPPVQGPKALSPNEDLANAPTKGKPKGKTAAARDPWADHQPVLSQPSNMVIRVGDAIDFTVEDTAYAAKRSAAGGPEPEIKWRLVADHDAWKAGLGVSVADLSKRNFSMTAARPGLTGLRVLMSMTTPSGVTRRASTSLFHAEIADDQGKRPAERAPEGLEPTDPETTAHAMQAIVSILQEKGAPKHFDKKLPAHKTVFDAWWRVMSRVARADGVRLIGAPYVETTLTKALSYAAGLTTPIAGRLDKKAYADLADDYTSALADLHARAAKIDAESDVKKELDDTVGGQKLDGLDEKAQLKVASGIALGTIVDASQGINDAIGSVTDATSMGEVIKTLDLNPGSAAAHMNIRGVAFGGLCEHLTAIVTAVNAYAESGELTALDPVARKAGLSAADHVSATKSALELLAGCAAVLGASLYVVAKAKGAPQAAAAALGFVTKGLAYVGHVCNVLGGIKGGFTLLDANASTSDKVKAGVDITVGLSSVASVGAEIVGSRAAKAAATAVGETAIAQLAGREAAAAAVGMVLGAAVASVQITYVSVNGVLEQGIAAYEGLMWKGMEPVFGGIRSHALGVSTHLTRLAAASAMLDKEEDPVRREVLTSQVRASEENLRIELELLLAHVLGAKDNQHAGFYPPLAKRFAKLAGRKLNPRSELIATASEALAAASAALGDMRPLFNECATWVWANHGISLW